MMAFGMMTENTAGDEDPSKQHRGGGILAGITRSFVYGLKAIPGTMVKASLQKQAFVTLGRRSNQHGGGTTHRYGYDGKPIVTPGKLTTKQRGIEVTKGSVLGSVVFSVYDMLMLTEMDKREDTTEHYEENDLAVSSAVKISGKDTPVCLQTSVRPCHYGNLRTPLYHHCLAGGISGAAFSIVSDGWDMVAQRLSLSSSSQAPAQHPTIHTNFLLRRLLHHTVGYATLFGSYECFRRLLVDGTRSYVASGQASVPAALQYGASCGIVSVTHGTNGDPEVYDMTALPLLCSFLAGGLAGQVHCVVEHYTRLWKLQAIGAASSGSVTLPPFRPTMASFLPTGACFVAFQYGAEFYERMIDQGDGAHHMYPFVVSETTPGN